MANLTPNDINNKYPIKNLEWKFYFNARIELSERLKVVIPTTGENISIYKYEGVFGHYERVNKSYETPDDLDPWNRKFNDLSLNSTLSRDSYFKAVNKLISNKIIRGLVMTTSVEGSLVYCVEYVWIPE